MSRSLERGPRLGRHHSKMPILCQARGFLRFMRDFEPCSGRPVRSGPPRADTDERGAPVVALKQPFVPWPGTRVQTPDVQERGPYPPGQPQGGGHRARVGVRSASRRAAAASGCLCRRRVTEDQALTLPLSARASRTLSAALSRSQHQDLMASTGFLAQLRAPETNRHSGHRAWESWFGAAGLGPWGAALPFIPALPPPATQRFGAMRHADVLALCRGVPSGRGLDARQTCSRH